MPTPLNQIWGLLVLLGSVIKDFISTVRSLICRILRAQSTWRLESKKKSINNGVVSRYPSSSVVYNIVGSGPAAAECTLRKWAQLTKIKFMCMSKRRPYQRDFGSEWKYE